MSVHNGVERPAPWALDRIDQLTLPLDGAYHYSGLGSGVNVYVVDTARRAPAGPRRAAGEAHRVSWMAGAWGRGQTGAGGSRGGGGARQRALLTGPGARSSADALRAALTMCPARVPCSAPSAAMLGAGPAWRGRRARRPTRRLTRPPTRAQGILTSHQEFRYADGAPGSRAREVFTSLQSGAAGEDCNGHGTHVAASVGGVVHGVAKNASLLAVRALECLDNGTVSQARAAARALRAGSVCRMPGGSHSCSLARRRGGGARRCLCRGDAGGRAGRSEHALACECASHPSQV